MSPFVGIRDGAVFVGHKSYSGLVYRGISDPSRRSTLNVKIWLGGSAKVTQLMREEETKKKRKTKEMKKRKRERNKKTKRREKRKRAKESSILTDGGRRLS